MRTYYYDGYSSSLMRKDINIFLSYVFLYLLAADFRKFTALNARPISFSIFVSPSTKDWVKRKLAFKNSKTGSAFIFL